MFDYPVPNLSWTQSGLGFKTIKESNVGLDQVKNDWEKQKTKKLV